LDRQKHWNLTECWLEGFAWDSLHFHFSRESNGENGENGERSSFSGLEIFEMLDPQVTVLVSMLASHGHHDWMIT